MNIKFIDSKTSPCVNEVFAKFPIETFKATKEIYVIASKITVRRIDTSLHIDKYRGGMNEEVEGIQTNETSEFSYLTSQRVVKHYFVKSKKQGLEEYKKYIAEILQRNLGHLGVEDLTVYLRVGNSFE